MWHQGAIWCGGVCGDLCGGVCGDLCGQLS